MTQKIVSIVLSLLLLLTLVPCNVQAAEENVIPDENFRKYLTEIGADTNSDGKISAEEAGNVSLGLAPYCCGIRSIEGAQYLSQVSYFDFTGNEVSDITPLLGMENLTYTAFSNNLIACSVLRGYDPETMDTIEKLEDKGVEVWGRESQRILEKSVEFPLGTPVYKILAVIVTSVDATVEKSMDSGDYRHVSYTMTDMDLAICKEYVRLFEAALECITDYSIDFDVELYVTEETVTDIVYRGISTADGGETFFYEYAIFGSGVPEIQNVLSNYDSSITIAYMDEELHRLMGFGHYNGSIERGEATLFYDPADASRIHSMTMDNRTMESWLNDLKNNFYDDGVDVMIHEFTHTVEQYAESRGYNIWDFHDALEQVKGESYETHIKGMGEYLTGLTNPKDTSQTGIPDFVYENPPTEYSTEHIWGEWVYQSYPSCTVPGYRQRVCSHCGKMEDEFPPAAGHTYVNHVCSKCGMTEENVSDFCDVYESDYYAAPVEWAYNHEPQITTGTDGTHFSPYTVCTREQVVTFLWRAFGCPEPKTTKCDFKDVVKGSYYYKAVLWAVENGITNGYDANTFGTGDYVTRAQTVTFLWRAAGKKEPTGSTGTLKDITAGNYYYKAVLWAVEKKITTGTDSTHFSPDETCTRAQVVTFLYRYLEG